MRLIRISIIFVIVLTFSCPDAISQVRDRNGIDINNLSTGSFMNDMGKTVNTDNIDMKDLPLEYGTKRDDQMKEYEQEMDDRKWSTEEEAWNQASTLNTKAAYIKYANIYPVGFHINDAQKRIIDFEIDEILNGEHEALPMMKCISEDDDSPTSTISIQNNTEYLLTVWYSGVDSRSITISPMAKQTITLNNGFYRIAAAVPNKNVRPYAGEEYVSGGQFETGYYIVYGH